MLGDKLYLVKPKKTDQGSFDMPLVKSTSKTAFRKNIAAEVNAGKPVKQAVAIAYSVQRKAGGGKAPPAKKK